MATAAGRAYNSYPLYPCDTVKFPVEPGGYEFPVGGPDSADCAEPCDTLDCDCYSMVETMALRAFWDVWDSNPDGDDTASITQTWDDMAEIWTLFPPGTCKKGCAQEDKSNMLDYHYNADGISADAQDDIWTVYSEDHTDMECQKWP